MARRIANSNKKKNLPQKRSQAALEYLITYGWAIVIILIALSLVYQSGIFDPEKYLPGTCTLEGAIGCLDYKITENVVELAVVNKLGEDISVSGITVPGCSGTASGTLRKGEQGTFRIGNCSISNSSKYHEAFNISYTAQSGIEHNLYGALGGNVESSVISTNIVSFKENGVGGINETNEAQISADNPNTNYGTLNVLTIDQQSPHSHAVIQFPNIIGNNVGQIPLNAQINSATLRVKCFNAGNVGRTYLLLENWTEPQVTWNKRTSTTTWGNPGADGVISRGSNPVDWTCALPTGFKNFDMTTFVQSWANGTPNYGVVSINTGTDGFDFYTSENTNATNRPLLTVNFTS